MAQTSSSQWRIEAMARRYNRRFDARRDENEPPLIRVAEQIGANFFREGPLDHWMAWRGLWVPVEIKDPDLLGQAHEYTPAQRRFLQFCHSHNMPWRTWRTRADVLRDLGAKVTA